MSQEELNARTLTNNGGSPMESDTLPTISDDKKPKDLTCKRLLALVNQLYDQEKQMCMSLKEQRRKLNEYMNLNIHIQDSDESQDDDENEDGVEKGDSDSDSDSNSDLDSESDDDSDSDETELSSDEEDSDSESTAEEQESSESDIIAVNMKSTPSSPKAPSTLRKTIVNQSALSVEVDSELKTSKCPALKVAAPMSCSASSSQSAPRIQRRTTMAGS
ncbi:bifunctional lysine-specific demethylase and histidyl-hydroxylase NO66 [Drosophila kikkawai]|uniref:Bifunctional lysine-specific demethylase and histidyl-hydroxylase NO66 n=1 Tax=Drosophila kikkawai TaxID=30033 RepID=A0A6P4ID65_DROKI|nr:clumping factor A [Drosophila kikkawai]